MSGRGCHVPGILHDVSPEAVSQLRDSSLHSEVEGLTVYIELTLFHEAERGGVELLSHKIMELGQLLLEMRGRIMVMIRGILTSTSKASTGLSMRKHKNVCWL